MEIWAYTFSVEIPARLIGAYLQGDHIFEAGLIIQSLQYSAGFIFLFSQEDGVDGIEQRISMLQKCPEKPNKTNNQDNLDNTLL